MKTFAAVALSASLALSTGVARAGGLADAIMEEPVVVVEPMEESSGSAGWIIPAIIVAALIAVAMSGDDECVECDSDLRLKTDIHLVGTSPSGLPVYTFRYLLSDTVYGGTMAQDVLMHRPEAVSQGLFGFLRVDYSQIDVEMRALN